MKKIFLLAALACTGAQAEFITGNELLARLNASDQYDRGVGMGYVMGVFDATYQITHCPPAGVTAGQVRDMIVKTLNTGAEVRHMAADGFITFTLKTAWPCAKKGSGI